jgi:hypothetical protein
VNAAKARAGIYSNILDAENFQEIDNKIGTKASRHIPSRQAVEKSPSAIACHWQALRMDALDRLARRTRRVRLRSSILARLASERFLNSLTCI